MTTPAGQNPQQNRRRTIEQKRGERAWEYIGGEQGVIRQQANYQKEYRSLARGLNAMIQINGLGQTLAFLKAKGNKKENGQPVQNPHRQLFEQLSRWISDQMQLQGQSDLLTWIIRDASTTQYRRATTEALAFGTWLRRFAEAELESE